MRAERRSTALTVRAQLGGTTQDLPGGCVLVAFGDGGRVQEYDAAGNLVWEIDGNAGYIFRAERIHSLYHPGQGPWGGLRLWRAISLTPSVQRWCAPRDAKVRVAHSAVDVVQ